MFRRPRPYITDPLPPAVPRGMVMQDTGESLLLEAQARLAHAARQVEKRLWAESMRPWGPRKRALCDALLDLRAALRPSPAGPDVLREGPPVPVGYAVPYVPGHP